MRVYVLISSDARRTYVGATKDMPRRLRQHNREIVGGARATAGRNWRILLTLAGHADWSSCLSCEWHVKHTHHAPHPLSARTEAALQRAARASPSARRRCNKIRAVLSMNRFAHLTLVDDAA